MAKVIQSEQKVIVEPWWVKGQIVYIGLGIGLLWWILTTVLRQYVIEPIVCSDLETAAACVNSVGVAGNVATVLVAVVGLLVLVKYLQPRPIVIAVATAVLLWNLAGLMTGLPWWAMLLWALFFYTASYILFSLIARLQWVAVSLLVATIVVVAIRIIVAL